MHTSRPVVRLLGTLAGAGLLVATGCGSPGGITKTSAAGQERVESGGHRSVMTLAAVRSAGERTASATSGRFTIRMAMGDSTTAPAVNVEGEFSGTRLHQTMTMGTGRAASGDSSFNLDMEMIVDGNDAYVKSSMFSELAPIVGESVDADAWMHMSSSQAGKLGVQDAVGAGAAKLLSGAYGDVTTVGTEDIDGVSTTHVRVAVDPSKIVGASADKLGLTADTFDADVWVDGDGIMRRMTYSMDPSGMFGGKESAASTMTATFEMHDVNADVSIELPDPAHVVEAPAILGGK